MKKLLIYMTTLLLCLACASCAGKASDLSDYKNVDTGAVVRLGMEQTEVEKLLGPTSVYDMDAIMTEVYPERDYGSGGNYESLNQSLAAEGLKNCWYGDAETYLYIIYRDEKIQSMSASAPEMKIMLERSAWSNAYELSYGASREEIVAAAGEPSETIDEIQMGKQNCEVLTYYYDASNKLMERYEDASIIMEYTVDNASDALVAYSVEGRMTT